MIGLAQQDLPEVLQPDCFAELVADLAEDGKRFLLALAGLREGTHLQVQRGQ